MKPTWEVLHPYPEVEEGRVTEDSFVVSPGGIWEHLEYGLNVNIDERYLDPEGFYRRTHFTEAMKNLLREVITRLNGGTAQSIHHLQVGMGGGKSHTLLLLYYMAKYREKVLPYLQRAGIAENLPPFRVAVLDGSRISTTFGKGLPDGSRVMTLWGLLFKQLGVYDRFKDVDKREESPDITMIREALTTEPTLILIDEITMYISSSPSRLASRIQAFLQALTAAVKETPRCAMVITTPIGVYPEALDLVSNILNRYCTPTVIAAAREYKNIRKRALFRDDFDTITTQIEEVAKEYQETYSRHLPNRAASTLDAIKDNYPFHPFVDDTLQRLKGHPAFQEVRDELRFLAGLIYSVWQHQEPDAYLISVGHADLEDQYVRGGTIAKVRDPIIVARFDSDLENNLPKIPDEIKATAKKALATIVLNSLHGPTPLDRGVTREDTVYALLTPESTPALIDEALKQIVTQLHYVNPLGDRYVFGQPNINKIIDDYIKKVETDEKLRGQWWDTIKAELMAWKDAAIKQYQRSAKERGQPPLFAPENIIIWANRSGDIPDDTNLKLVFTDYIIPEAEPRERTPSERVAATPAEACKAVKDLYDSYGQRPRNNKNTVFFLVADRNLVERNGPVATAKQLLALQEMLRDREDLRSLIGESGLNSLDRSRAEMERDLRPSSVAAYQYLVYPAAGGLAAIQLSEERRAIDRFITLVEERLETQQKKILRETTPTDLIDRYWPTGRDMVEVRELVEGFYRRPEIEAITDKRVVEAAIRAALREGLIAYTHQGEVYFNREPTIIDDRGILVKNPNIATVSIEAVDERGEPLRVRLLLDGKREEFTPTAITNLKGVSQTVKPIPPDKLSFKAWEDGHQTEERTVTWDQNKTLVLHYEVERPTERRVTIEVKAVNAQSNEELAVAVLVDGASYGTPTSIERLKDSRCEISIATPSGMSFQGWSDGSRYLKRTITFDYDKVLTAAFQPVTPGIEVVKWSGPNAEAAEKIRGLLEGSARYVKTEFSANFQDLSRHLGALLHLLSPPYVIDLQARGGRALGFDILTVSARAGSEKQSGLRSCLTQLKGFLEEATLTLEKKEGDYKPMAELIRKEALDVIAKMEGRLTYEIHMLTDPTRKPEPTRTLKTLIDEFKRVG